MKLVSIPKHNAKAPYFRFVAASAIYFVCVFGFTVWALVSYAKISKEAGYELRNADGGGWRIDYVFSGGPADGILQPGDIILAINGDETARRNAPVNLGALPLEQESYTMRVERGGEKLELNLTMPLSVSYQNILPHLPPLPGCVAFVIVGLLVGAIKPTEKSAQLASLALLVTASITVNDVLRPFSHYFQDGARALYFLTGIFFPFQFVFAYHFYYRFPPETPTGRFWDFLKYFFYAAGAAVFFVVNARNSFYFLDAAGAFNFFQDNPQYHEIYVFLRSYFETIAVSAIFAVIIRNYVVNKESDRRRRSRLLMYSSVASFFILLLSNVTYAVGYLNPLGFSSYALDWLTSVVIIVIPVSVGYSILKHKMFDINIVIRRTLQYLLAKNGLRLLLSLPLAGLLVTVLSNPNRTLSEILFNSSVYFYMLAIVALLVSLTFRRRLGDWIDRKFFRTAYSQEKVLLDLIEKVKQLDSIPGVAEAVSKELEKAFHPKNIHIFYREQERQDLVLGYSSGGRSGGSGSGGGLDVELSRELSIPSDFRLLRFMEDTGGAQEFPFPDKNRLPQKEKEWLARLEVNLIVPMNGSDETLTGLLLLGEKKSEEDYTPNDCRLLEGLAGQMAIVYENLKLKRRVREEQKLQREVLAHFAEENFNLVKECPLCGLCFDSDAEICPDDRLKLQFSLPVERTIEGKYRLEKLLGKGGMGAVYAAADLRIKRRVAVKLMLGNLFGDPTALRRFKREAQACARLSHPNIVAVYDFGSLKTKKSEGAFMVMEFVPGATLRAKIKQRSVTPDSAADWFNQMLEGVKAAHAAGIVHRDLKPENILIADSSGLRTADLRNALDPDILEENRRKQNPGKSAIPNPKSQIVKILDFGLAKVVRRGEISETAPASVTSPGAVMGTYNYMSPEQIEGKRVDERSDLFSLGVMVVESLTGSRPFNGDSVAEIARAILLDEFHFAGDAPEIKNLDAALQKCLAKDPRRRFQTATEMQREIIPLMRAFPLGEKFAPPAIDSFFSTLDQPQKTLNKPAKN
jgi:eukaryotic-like serine/threonine-protein kinase